MLKYYKSTETLQKYLSSGQTLQPATPNRCLKSKKLHTYTKNTFIMKNANKESNSRRNVTTQGGTKPLIPAQGMQEKTFKE
jgi:hypothetical protein